MAEEARAKAAKRAPAKKAPAKRSAPAAKASNRSVSPGAWSDGYEGVDWELYEWVRPHVPHSGATGAGLVEYTLWLEVIENRPPGSRKDIPLPGQPVR